MPYVTRRCPRSAGLAAGSAQREIQGSGEIPLLRDVRGVRDQVEANAALAGAARREDFGFEDDDGVVGAVAVVAHPVDARTRRVIAGRIDVARETSGHDAAMRELRGELHPKDLQFLI